MCALHLVDSTDRLKPKNNQHTVLQLTQVRINYPKEPSFTGGLQGIYELCGIWQEIQLTFPHTTQNSMPQN